MTKHRIVVAVLAGLLAAGGFLIVEAGPAFACSCRAGVPVEESLAESDGAFVGVFTGREDPLGQGDIVSSGRRVLNHFQVERPVKGDIGGRVDVTAAAGGASCGLELQVGQRTGLLLRRDAGGGGWTSGLCSQVEPQALLAFAPAAAPGSDAPGSDAAGLGAGSDAAGAGPDWGLMVLVGLLVMAVAGAVLVEVVHRRTH